MSFSLRSHTSARSGETCRCKTTDEELLRCVRPSDIAATGDLNPHWFGHPGSTVIYPTAALIHTMGCDVARRADLRAERGARRIGLRHISDALLSHRSVLGDRTRRCRPSRSCTCSGRRAFSRRIATRRRACCGRCYRYAIDYGRIVRTESAALFFGMLALYCCVRSTWQRDRRRYFAGVGRFCCQTTPTAYALVDGHARSDSAGSSSPTCTSPDRPHRGAGGRVARGCRHVRRVRNFDAVLPSRFLQKTRRDMSAEANVTHTVADGLSRPGNTRWYLTEAHPQFDDLGDLRLGSGRDPVDSAPLDRYQLILVTLCAIFLVGISSSSLHWQRWSIELLTLLVLLLDAVAGSCLRCGSETEHPPAQRIRGCRTAVVTAPRDRAADRSGRPEPQRFHGEQPASSRVNGYKRTSRQGAMRIKHHCSSTFRRGASLRWG